MGPVLKALFWKAGNDALEQDAEIESFFQLRVRNIQGQMVSLEEYANRKAILVVNVASRCKLTFENYRGLTQMHNQLSEQGLQILAFPCNQFLNQEDQSHEHIIRFVRHKFGTKFPLFEKVDVNGPNTHAVYRFLRRQSCLYDKENHTAKEVPWNFCKFLLNHQGKVVRFFDPHEQIAQIRKQVEKLL